MSYSVIQHESDGYVGQSEEFTSMPAMAKQFDTEEDAETARSEYAFPEKFKVLEIFKEVLK